MKSLDDVLAMATREVGAQFFLLPLDGQASVFRERVYCYELYHQMRRLWREDEGYALNGEVDKAGHKKLREFNADKCKPDFLVHTPGCMDGNFAVIEVKPANAPLKGLRKDAQTLRLFLRDVGYQRAIYLLYGEKADEAAEKVRRLCAEDPFKLEIWAHRYPGTPAVRI